MTVAGAGILFGFPILVLLGVVWRESRREPTEYDRRMDGLETEQRLREGRLP